MLKTDEYWYGGISMEKEYESVTIEILELRSDDIITNSQDDEGKEY